MDTANNTFPALQFPASELSAFAVTMDVFTISLKNGKLVQFKPHNVQTFYDWLIAHGVRDIKEDERAKEKPPDNTKSGGWKALFKYKHKNENHE